MDTLNNNWCIKLDKDNIKEVISYLNNKYGKSLEGGLGHFYGECNNVCDWRISTFGKELTFEEFKTQILGEGYKSEILGTSQNNPPIKTSFDGSKFLQGLNNDTKNVFDKTLTSLADLLKYKNEKYGNSALEPLEIFGNKCKVGTRLDDKLARVKNSNELKKNDIADLIGYLTLICIENNWDSFEEFKD